MPGVVRIPDETATEEERKAFYAKLAPKAPEEYEFSFVGTDEQGNRKGPGDETLADYRRAAHEAGLSPAQAESLGKWMNDRAMERVAERKAERDKAWATLSQEYGENGVEQRKTLASAVVDKFAKDETQGNILKSALATSPELIHVLSGIGEQLGEAVDAGLHGGSDEMDSWSTTMIDQRLSELTQSAAYIDNEHPDHKRVVAETERLYKTKTAREERAKQSAA